MFKKEKIKLTAQYLSIIMAISFFFSLIIYQGATFELKKVETAQRIRRPGIGTFAIDPEVLEESRHRIAGSLFILNLFILGASSVSGYFLAGKTLSPIEKMLEDQKNFISHASHELKTPLTALKSEIEITLRNKKLTIKQAKKQLVSNLEEVDKMNRLSNYLLRLDKLQHAGKLNLKKVDLKDVINLAIKKISPLAKVKNIKIRKKISKKVVSGDKESLIELVVILLDNAIKYSNKKSRIYVSTSRLGFLVKDEGKGIDKKDLPHVFNKFYGNGFGLGLSIAKGIADEHSAKIKVESKVGKGTIFKVNFS